MTERWKPEDPENEPIARLNLPNGEYAEARRDNSHLYTHLGELALFDYVRVNGEQSNVLIFNFVDGYKELAMYMLENEYPLHANMPEVEDGIEDSFYRAQGFNVPDSIEDIGL